MSPKLLTVHELAAWGLDAEIDRGEDPTCLEAKIASARRHLLKRQAFCSEVALLHEETALIAPLVRAHSLRDDFERECRGLAWEIGVVDLRALIAFQRRVSLGDPVSTMLVPRQNDWEQLVALAFPYRTSSYSIAQSQGKSEAIVRSLNPDLTVELGNASHTVGNRSPISIYHGSPFIEVGEYKGRWFLRDGYHRAYALLQAGVYCVPALIIKARTLEELGPVQPWFFDELTLFSQHPPMLTDFHNRDLTLSYLRPMREKVIRITFEESFQVYEGVTE